MKQQQTIKPFVLGLTGSIASGKTAALEAFKQCGVFTLSADVLTHQVLGLASVQKKIAKKLLALPARRLWPNWFLKMLPPANAWRKSSTRLY